MEMTSSNTIRPNGEHPQVHIIVKSNAPKSSVIAKMYREGVKKAKPELGYYGGESSYSSSSL